MSAGENFKRRHLTPEIQRNGIMALLAKNEGQVLLADEIVAVWKGKFPRKLIYKRLNELEHTGWVERLWWWYMPMPRFGVSDMANERLKALLIDIIRDAGPDGITEHEANNEMISRIMDGGLNLESGA